VREDFYRKRCDWRYFSGAPQGQSKEPYGEEESLFLFLLFLSFGISRFLVLFRRCVGRENFKCLRSVILLYINYYFFLCQSHDLLQRSGLCFPGCAVHVCVQYVHSAFPVYRTL